MKTENSPTTGFTRWLPHAVLLCAVIGFLMSFMPPKAKTEIKVREFGALPVLVKGRIQPWDSLARNALLSIREVSDFNDRDLGVKMSASEWLLEAMCKPAEANARKVFKVDELDLKTLLGAENKAVKFFSANEIAAKLNDLREVLKSGTETTADGRMRQKKTSELTPYQKAAQQLWRKFNYYLVIQNALHVADTQTFQAQMEQVLSGAEQEPAKDKFSWETELSRYEQYLPKDFASIHAQPGKDELTKEQRIYFVFVQRYKQLQEEAAFGENAVGITPSAKNPDEFDTLFESLTKAVFAQKVDAGVRNYSRMVTAYQRGDASAFNTALTDQQTLLAAAPGVLSTAKHERIFNDADPFNFTITLYVCVLLLSLFSWLGMAQPLGKATRWLLVFTFALHTAGIITRIVLIDRPPVINLYSAAVFVGWGAAGLALLLEFYFRGCIASAAAAMVGFGTLIIASHKALEGDTLEMMQAVLDSNFWLATHVVIINLGYSATYLAGTLGILYVLRGVFTPSLDEELGRKLERSVYAITCFAALFSFTGTVLGGIWADQSWGRFWGWDPKENGALLIVLWCLVILHARWGRYMGARGLMAAAIFGNIVTSISFFGTNMLDIGLHSYGRSENGALRLWQFSLSQLVLIAIALLPFKWWRSGKQLAKTT